LAGRQRRPTTPAGWAGEATFAYSWPDAEAKARAAVRWLRERAERRGLAIEEWCEESEYLAWHTRKHVPVALLPRGVRVGRQLQ
jgi:hypothetical protein